MEFINNRVNTTVKKMVTGFNDYVIELGQQITDLKQQLGKSRKEIASLKDFIQDNQLRSDEENVRITPANFAT